jgi:hypothetical protein
MLFRFTGVKCILNITICPIVQKDLKVLILLVVFCNRYCNKTFIFSNISFFLIEKNITVARYVLKRLLTSFSHEEWVTKEGIHLP